MAFEMKTVDLRITSVHTQHDSVDSWQRPLLTRTVKNSIEEINFHLLAATEIDIASRHVISLEREKRKGIGWICADSRKISPLALSHTIRFLGCYY